MAPHPRRLPRPTLRLPDQAPVGRSRRPSPCAQPRPPNRARPRTIAPARTPKVGISTLDFRPSTFSPQPSADFFPPDSNSSRRGPVRAHPQAHDAGEMPGVAGHQSQVVFQRDCGLPHIVVADMLAAVLEPTGDPRSDPRRSLADLQTTEACQGQPGVFNARGTLGKFRPRDPAHIKRLGRVPGQKRQSLGAPARTPRAAEIDQKIRIEEHRFTPRVNGRAAFRGQRPPRPNQARGQTRRSWPALIALLPSPQPEVPDVCRRVLVSTDGSVWRRWAWTNRDSPENPGQAMPRLAPWLSFRPSHSNRFRPTRPNLDLESHPCGSPPEGPVAPHPRRLPRPALRLQDQAPVGRSRRPSPCSPAPPAESRATAHQRPSPPFAPRPPRHPHPPRPRLARLARVGARAC